MSTSKWHRRHSVLSFRKRDPPAGESESEPSDSVTRPVSHGHGFFGGILPRSSSVNSIQAESNDLDPQTRLLTRKPAPRPYSTSSSEVNTQARVSSSPEPRGHHKLRKSQSNNLLNIPSASNPTPTSSPKQYLDLSPRGRDTSPGHALHTDVGHIRSVSSPFSGHMDSSTSDGGTSDAGKTKKRLSWMPGSKHRSSSSDATDRTGPRAWVLGGPNQVEYNLDLLLHGEKVPELWDDNGDVHVYLFPPETMRGPSFKISSRLISASVPLMKLAFPNLQSVRSRTTSRSFDGRSSLSAEDATRRLDLNASLYNTTQTSQDLSSDAGGVDALADGHLAFPFTEDDNDIARQPDRLIAARNLFAFLAGRALIATKRYPTAFSLLCSIASQLNMYQFTNSDGDTFGEVANACFDYHIDQLGLADVRGDCQKIIEGIILGEQMRSVDLYNEGFTHCVGQYHAVRKSHPPLFNMISENTRNRLERADFNLQRRLKGVNLRIADFDIPSLFNGSAASTSSDESKVVRYKAWKSNFSAFRKFILGYYKDLHGSWPPKASSKKNDFSEGGLNRVVLQILYSDFCHLYDLLVDREKMTTRVMEQEARVGSPDSDRTVAEMTVSALRSIMSEYDNSSPPVLPPIPFDLPIIPNMAILAANHNLKPAKEQAHEENRRLKDHEIGLILGKTHNMGAEIRHPFIDAFRSFEENEARGSSINDIADQRFGNWLFIYVVLQALPLVVIDAPGLRFTDDVEYFLCNPPLGNPPWVQEHGEGQDQRSWFGVQGGGMVSLPSHVVIHGTEGIYRRSHCWTVAEAWAHALDLMLPPPTGALDGQFPQDPPLLSAPQESTDDLRPFSQVQDPYAGFARSQSSEGIAHNFSRPGSGQMSRPGSRHDSQGFLIPSQPGSRSDSKHRISIAPTLEPLPLPPSFVSGYGSRPASRSASEYNSAHSTPRLGPVDSSQVWSAGTGSGSLTFSPLMSETGSEEDHGHRGRHVSGLHGMSEPGFGGEVGEQPKKKEMSFDDILGGIEGQTNGKKKKGLWKSSDK